MKARDLSLALKRAYGREALASFVVSMLSNAFILILIGFLGAGAHGLAVILVTFLVIPVVVSVALSTGRVLDRSRRVSLNPSKRRPTPRKGLIFLVSQNEVVFREAIKPHESTLQHIWLICSKQTFPLAEKLREEQEVKNRAIDALVVNDVHDPLEFYQRVKTICAGLPKGLQVSDVIADYVGMTAHASVGTVLACLVIGLPLQYTPGEYDQELKAVRPLPSFEVEIKFVRPKATDASKSPAESNESLA